MVTPEEAVSGVTAGRLNLAGILTESGDKNLGSTPSGRDDKSYL
jgi:hypothetical protein